MGKANNRLLEIRLKMGYKRQSDFADYLGVHRVQYNQYENNRKQPQADVILQICIKLNMDIREIFYLTDD